MICPGAAGRRWLVALGLLLAASPAAGHPAANPTEPRPVSTAKEPAHLPPVPIPDLSRLDPPVQLALREARAHLDSVLARGAEPQADLAETYGETGMLYQAHLLFAPAQACYRNAMRLQPRDHRWPYYLGYAYEQQGQPRQAAPYYAAALERKPDLAVARLRLGRVYLDLGRFQKAAPLLQTAVRIPALKGAASFSLGELAYARQDFAQAVHWLEQTLRVDPKATRAQYTLGLAYRSLGNLVQARRHLALRGEAEPELPDPLVDALLKLSTGQRMLFKYAVDAVRRGEYEHAVHMFREGLALDGDNLDARVSFARALYLNGDKRGAKLELEAVLEREPRRALAQFLLGVLNDETGDAQAAMEHLRRATATAPEHPGAHFYLANILMRRGAYAQAARHYALSLHQEPDNTYARLREILALIKSSAPQSILRQRLESAYARDPTNTDFAYLLGALLAASPDAAVRNGPRAVTVARALYQAKHTPQYGELLAMAYAQVGDFSKATDLQTEALATAVAQGRTDLQSRLLANLSLFQANKPCRSPWPDRKNLVVKLPATDAFRAFKDYPTDAAY